MQVENIVLNEMNGEEEFVEEPIQTMNHDQKLQKFNEMQKDMPSGNRRSFVEKRRRPTKNDSRKRGQTYANKLTEDNYQINEEDYDEEDDHYPDNLQNKSHSRNGSNDSRKSNDLIN